MIKRLLQLSLLVLLIGLFYFGTEILTKEIWHTFHSNYSGFLPSFVIIPLWILFGLPPTLVYLFLLGVVNWITDWFGYPPGFFRDAILLISPFCTGLLCFGIILSMNNALSPKTQKDRTRQLT